ncbi:MAG TPA: Calx-beta domain-containing protein, partial [Mycobacteriales bacterium]|nr:Calx-beta domain-containing protein [Mycobacteriales bacterium]
ATSDVTAKAGEDYQAASGTITFNPGETTKIVNVFVNGDTKFEPNETFTVTVTPSGGAPATGTGTIINDDVPGVTVSDARVVEGNSGITPMIFTVTLTAPTTQTVQATYRTTDGTATAGQDYESASGTITFAPGVTTQTITVNVIGDTLFEPDETFTLTVTPVGGVSVTATGTILNDDASPIAALRIVSGNGQSARLGQTLPQPLVVEVTNSLGAVVSGVAVDWKATKGDATLNPATSTTNAQGRASTTATLGSVGAVEVQASVKGLPPVTFTFTSATLLEQHASGPVAVPIARALDIVCAQNDTTFAAACRALSGLDDAQLTSTLERVAPLQSGVESKVSSEFVSQVTSGIQSRLRSLRGGARRFDVQKLSLNVGGRPIPVAMMSMALLPQQGSAPEAAASTQEEKDYN